MIAARPAGRPTADLLERALGIGVRSLRAWPHPYSTSHPLVAADVELADGRTLELVVKDHSARPAAKPLFLYRRQREREMYEEVLPHSTVPAPRLLGTAGTSLVLERVSGVPLWQCADPSPIGVTAKAIRALHQTHHGAGAAFLVRYDRSFYRRWARRAVAVEPELERFSHTYTLAAERLLAEASVVIHGELYPSNVLVDPTGVSIVDWETAAEGPAVVDLAALTSGWSPEHERAVLSAYGPVDPVALDCARLHLAFRWIGWSARWRPPEEHAYDWPGEVARTEARIREALE